MKNKKIIFLFQLHKCKIDFFEVNKKQMDQNPCLCTYDIFIQNVLLNTLIKVVGFLSGIVVLYICIIYLMIDN